MIITVGKKAVEGIVEFKFRKDNVKEEKTIQEAIDIAIDTINSNLR